MDVILDLSGKVALVTGASRGIGRYLATAMARQGATLVVTARRLDSVAGSGRHASWDGGGDRGERADRAFAIPASISDPAGAKALIEQAVEAAGRLDILVNNAATYPEVRIEDMDVEEWQEAVDINLNAIFYLTHYALPIMAAQGGGRIVNVSSEMAVYRRPTRVAYTATKAAVDAFSLALSEETRAQNVEVNVWTPGFVPHGHERLARHRWSRDGGGIVPVDALAGAYGVDGAGSAEA